MNTRKKKGLPHTRVINPKIDRNWRRRVEAVSYTHLDVYKRQEKQSAHCLALSLRLILQANNFIFMSIRPPDFIESYDLRLPISTAFYPRNLLVLNLSPTRLLIHFAHIILGLLIFLRSMSTHSKTGLGILYFGTQFKPKLLSLFYELYYIRFYLYTLPDCCDSHFL